MIAQRGRLFVLSAPSGAGKSTLVSNVIEAHRNLRFSISYTTRPPRKGEVDGVEYFFLDQASFDAMHDADEFLEHAEVFGHHYGTGRGQIEQLLDAGHDVLLEIDWQGARQVRANQPDCCSIFILPPSIAELERRLRNRGTDTEDVIQRRLSEAIDDMSHSDEFDHVVINDDLDQAVKELTAVITGETVPE